VLRKVARLVEVGARARARVGVGVGTEPSVSTSVSSSSSSSTSTSTIRIDASTRDQLKRIYVTHYKTIVEFLEHCLPYLKKLLSDRIDSSNYGHDRGHDDSEYDDEI
jgi:hypothetical protein